MIKQIENYTGYFISDDGKVYCNLGKGNRKKEPCKELYEIKPRKTKNGYMRVYMRNNITNKRKDEYVHRLVATYFVPNPYNKPIVNHINCDRSDNRASNLEWVTTKENRKYTETLNHLIRDLKTGRYVSNFIYE